MRLILFDIDGTLIKCGIQVKGIFSSALVEVFGQTGDLDSYDFSGKIDTQIVFDLQEGAGLPRQQVAERLPLFKEVYVDRLERELDGAVVGIERRPHPGHGRNEDIERHRTGGRNRDQNRDRRTLGSRAHAREIIRGIIAHQ